jgi:hypothetical protein
VPARAVAMAGRLPQLYREGELLTQVLEVLGLPLEILDEEALAVQRAHWFDHALELEEAARLAALLDIAPEPWQSPEEYRVWVHALRDAMLEQGSVTRSALAGFVREYSDGYQAAAGITALGPIDQEGTGVLVENPLRRRYGPLPAGPIEPLARFTLVNTGLDPAPVACLLTGLPGAPEAVPVLVNLTTGRALVFLGTVPPGRRLWIRPASGGTAAATLEQRDVSDRIRSVDGVAPGRPWDELTVESPGRTLVLEPGPNELWFLPVAHFDAPGLNRFLMALADLLMALGRYDLTAFDHSLFFLDPVVSLRLTWVETEPASVDVLLPAGGLLGPAGDHDRSLDERERLGFALDLAVRRLKAAGVRATVEFRGHHEVQPQGDFLTAVLPQVSRERGPTGVDALPDPGGLFDVTRFEDSTYR